MIQKRSLLVSEMHGTMAKKLGQESTQVQGKFNKKLP